MAFIPIYNAFQSKPKSQWFKNPSASQAAGIRDNFYLTTWLMMGAFLQGLVCLLPYKNIVLIAPVAIALFLMATRTLLQAKGLLRHPWMEAVIDRRTVPVFPDEKGNYEKPADQQVCAIMLAARSNHPLGMFADGFKEVGDYFTAMSKELDRNPTAHGYLGSSSWLSNSDRGVSSEAMTIIYFDSLDSLHTYAHGPLHTEAMEWWHKTESQHKHVGIMHEVFATPKNSWEGIYVNYHPTGLGATRKEVMLNGEKVWMNPLVECKGKLRYSKGRMGRPFGEKQEWPAFEAHWEQGGYGQA